MISTLPLKISSSANAEHRNLGLRISLSTTDC
jgi:hypothetical protein